MILCAFLCWGLEDLPEVNPETLTRSLGEVFLSKHIHTHIYIHYVYIYIYYEYTYEKTNNTINACVYIYI